MSALKARIVDLIGALGPLPVSEYMATCLSDPQHGYYMTRDPFGRDGDFTTAPEISQMFGELIGAWLADSWTRLGSPRDAIIAEIGPGRAALMKDIVRTLARIAPALRDNARFVLVETSEKLARAQAETLEASGGRFEWVAHAGALPPGPLLVVANELFDAIPIRQYVRTAAGWRERMVALDDRDELVFAAGSGSLDPTLLPDDAADAPEGAIVELAPARSALMQALAERLAAQGGVGLFIDYGYTRAAVGDTLQALLRHRYDDPLTHPGEADLTSHVDFAALAAVARAAGLSAHLTTQGEFLLALGLRERATRLGMNGDAALRQRLTGEVDRLAGEEAMGTLFKVLAVAAPGLPLAGFPPPA
ncbi:MAG: class I SAM-dependent methyltransferase [Rhizobiaceae bacterium]